MLHRGRLPKTLHIGEIRELSPEDLLRLRDKRSVPVVQRLRDPHHRVARLLAFGLRPAEVAAECGYSLARIYTLQADPSVQDLVAKYRGDVNSSHRNALDEYHAEVNSLNRKSLRCLHEHFDEADEKGELVAFEKALKTFVDTSDRVGISKKTVQTNVNIDFAAKLEKARVVRDAQMKVVNPPLIVRRI